MKNQIKDIEHSFRPKEVVNHECFYAAKIPAIFGLEGQSEKKAELLKHTRSCKECSDVYQKYETKEQVLSHLIPEVKPLSKEAEQSLNLEIKEITKLAFARKRFTSKVHTLSLTKNILSAKSVWMSFAFLATCLYLWSNR